MRAEIIAILQPGTEVLSHGKYNFWFYVFEIAGYYNVSHPPLFHRTGYQPVGQEERNVSQYPHKPEQGDEKQGNWLRTTQ
jgi:hypothetical protein